MSRRRPPDRIVRREPNGDLVDERRGRAVTLDELRDDLRAGKRFRARRADGGDCTYSLLAELLTGRQPGVAVAGRPGGGSLIGRLFGDALDWADREATDERRPRRGARERAK